MLKLSNDTTQTYFQPMLVINTDYCILEYHDLRHAVPDIHLQIDEAETG